MSRAADFERIVLGESIATPEIISNVDKLWNAIITGSAVVPIIPITPIEKYLAHLIDSSVAIPQPKTRLDNILYAICTSGALADFTPLSENEELLFEILENGIFTRATAQGVTLTLENSRGRNLYAYKIYGNSVQAGTPTPTTPIPIYSVGSGGAITANSEGKNLLKYPYYSSSVTVSGVQYTDNGDGTVTTIGTAISTDDSIFHFEMLLRVKAGTYTMSGAIGGSETTYRILVYKTDWTQLGQDVGSGVQFTLDEEADLRIYLWIKRGFTINKTFYPILERGTTATEFEQYHTPITTEISDGITLHKVGAVSDIIENGEDGTARLIKNCGYIESYNGETIETDYISSTGELTAGASVVYVLEQPIIESIAPAEIPTFEGTTIISLDTETQPSNMECEYYATNI